MEQSESLIELHGPVNDDLLVHRVSLHDGGKDPLARLLQHSQGNLYGTTQSGGGTSRGTIFKLTADGVETNLHVFNQTDGQDPSAGLIIGADGAFYGVTPTGGLRFGKGTIFRITADGQFTVIHEFTAATVPCLPASSRQRREPIWDHLVGWRWSGERFPKRLQLES